MTSLIKENGIETNDNDEIVNEVRTFYEQLYKSRDETLEDVNLFTRLAEDTPKLSDEEAQRKNHLRRSRNNIKEYEE